MSRVSSPGSMAATDVNIGETGSVLKSDFNASSSPAPRSPKESTTMKKDYDFLAAPLAALRAGEVGRAIQMLTELQMVKPEITETVYHLGRAHQAAGDHVSARLAYEEVVAQSGHSFYSHALARLTELSPARATNTGIVPPHITEAIAEATVVVVEPPAAPSAEAPSEDAAQVESSPAQAEAVPAPPAESATASQVEAASAEQAPSPAAGKKGKKAKAEAPSADASQTPAQGEGESS